MWLIAVSLPLLPAIVMASSRYRAKVTALCRGAVAWVLRLLRGKVCVKTTHAFVFTNCTHGKADSVLRTFELYAETHLSLSVAPQIGEMLDEVMSRVRPLRVLELGMHCGYSSVRLLRLLPPAGKLTTVELDPVTADLGEEMILVAGFKHSQFQVISGSSAEAIQNLQSYLEPDKKTSEGIDLVLMDHDPRQYLPDLLALEQGELLCPSGCSVVLVKRDQSAAELRRILDHVSADHRYCIKRDLPCMMEIFYQTESQRSEAQQ